MTFTTPTDGYMVRRLEKNDFDLTVRQGGDSLTLANNNTATARHQFVPPPFDVDDSLCRAVVKDSGECRQCFQSASADVHKIEVSHVHDYRIRKIEICVLCGREREPF